MGTKVQATDGRVIGTRATQTRARLLEATAKLLEERSALDLKVIDVTREARTSPATFYQYFSDVSDAVLQLARQAGEDAVPMIAYLEHEWTGNTGKQHALDFVSAFIEYWMGHSALLRVRNLQAEEGDDAFRRARGRALKPFLDALVSKIEANQKTGRISTELSPYATASAILATLERLVSYIDIFEQRGVSQDDMKRTLAILIFQMVTGESW